YLDKISVLAQNLGQVHWPSLVVAGLTLAVMLLWPRLKTPVPAHLPAVIIGSLIALALAHAGFAVDTIDSRFSYTAADGSIGRGIPPIVPGFSWPWNQSGADGEPLALTWSLVRDLL